MSDDAHTAKFRELVTRMQGNEHARARPASLAGKRLHQQAPNFRASLADEPLIAGWSHNPWADSTSPDAIATAIADRYIRRFTQAISNYGYLPFTGTEVNMGIRSAQPDAAENALHAIERLYENLHAYAKQFHPPDAPTPYIDSRLSLNDEMHGRIYLDGSLHGGEVRPGLELEIANPAQSPMATVVRTREVKRVAYSATQQYATRFNRSADATDPDQPIPAGQAAEFIAGQVGAANVYFADRRGAAGEHLSFSLLKRDPHFITDYEHARRHSPMFEGQDRYNPDAFGQANLIQRGCWANVMRMAFERHLSNDELLAFGHAKKFALLNGGNDRSKHLIRVHRPNNSKDEWPAEAHAARLELRSFNDTSSNASLSMLAVVATAYGVLKVIHDDLGISKTKAFANLSPREGEIVMRLGKYARPNPIVSRYIDEAKWRFNEQSLTLAMMRDLAAHAPNPAERNQILSDIEAFRTAIEQRTEIIQSQTVSNNRTR